MMKIVAKVKSVDGETREEQILMLINQVAKILLIKIVYTARVRLLICETSQALVHGEMKLLTFDLDPGRIIR